MQTVLFRIFYSTDRGRTNRLNLSQFRSLDLITMLEATALANISESNCLFSYKHFYVIYCLFWEIDSDHDGVVGRYEMLAYDRGSVTTRVIDRVLRGWGRGAQGKANNKMDYEDFCCASPDDTSMGSLLTFRYRVCCV